MKSAFLIMAHGNFEMLKLLITMLDYKDNDIYIHIDKKCGDLDFAQFEHLTKESSVYFLKNRMKITWGSVSQIQLELKMFDYAFKGGVKYDYFHLLSGVDCPLKTNEEISNFLERNNHSEFIGIVGGQNVIKQRLGYYHLYTERNIIGKLYRHLLIPLQRVFHIHNVNDVSVYRMGPNWCSVTYDLVSALLKEKNNIIKRYRYSFCCDEVFLQTFVFEHKEFLNRIYCPNDQYKSCMRYIDFKRGNPYIFNIKDMEELYKADRFFARKVTMEVMQKLQKHLF